MNLLLSGPVPQVTPGGHYDADSSHCDAGVNLRTHFDGFAIALSVEPADA